MHTDKIDGPCIDLMTDEQLSQYIPAFGDRLALRGFVKPVKRKHDERKQSLFERLRMKLKKGSSPSKDNQCEQKYAQAKNAMKESKTVGIGLMKFDRKKKFFRQVRTNSGGGTRSTSLPKTSTKLDILTSAKTIFFPNGTSVKLGEETQFDFDVMDYQFVKLEEQFTIQQISEITKLKNLRFYLTIKDKDLCELHDETPGPSKPISPGIGAKTSTITSSSEYEDTTTCDKTTSKNDIPLHGTDTSSNDSLPSLTSITNTAGNVTGEHVTETSMADVLLIDSFPPVQSFTAEVPQDPTVTEPTESSIDIDMLFSEFENAHNMVKNHTIRLHRGHVYEELMAKFRDESFNFSKDLFTLEMVLPNGEPEIAEDNGGVVRDALTEFWKSFCDKCTLGNDCKVPFLRHDYSDADWKSIATVIFFGWSTQRYFPICLSKAFMSCAIYGMDIFSENKKNMISDFLSFLPEGESRILSAALKDDFDQEEVMDILGSHECRVVPTKENLEKILGEIAHKEVIQQPMYVKDCWFNQLTALGFDLNTSLETLYESAKPNPRKVIKILSFPDEMSPVQSATSGFLTKYIRELNSDDLSKFLRFCTGSDLLLTTGNGENKPIFVRFNTLSGLSRRPVGHTCGQVLDVPEQYDSYIEFRAEFNSLLRSDIWIMDFV